MRNVNENLLSKGDKDAETVFMNIKKVSDETIEKTFLLLNDFSYSKSKNILQKAISKLSEKATLHT